MRSSCFSEGQMAPILREADTEPVSEAAKPRGIREVTIYAWRKRYGEVEAADLRRLRQMKNEEGECTPKAGSGVPLYHD
ncbi:MAG: transposase [Pseudomonadota bacterium]